MTAAHLEAARALLTREAWVGWDLDTDEALRANCNNWDDGNATSRAAHFAALNALISIEALVIIAGVPAAAAGEPDQGGTT